MPIKCLFLIENLQMMWKCKTGYTVNQKQITLLDTLYCFYEHVLQSIHYAVCPFESWLLYSSYKETCEWLCNKPWKSGQNWTFLLLFESASLKSLPGEFLQEAHPCNTHSKPCVKEREGKTCHSVHDSRWRLSKECTAAILSLQVVAFSLEAKRWSKEIGLAQNDLPLRIPGHPLYIPPPG